MMQDYGDSFEPLIARKISPNEIEIIDDFDYSVLKGTNFAAGYSQFHQNNYVQLPTGLMNPRKISRMQFKFALPKRPEDEDNDSQPDQLRVSQPKPEKESDGFSSTSSSSQSSSSDDEQVLSETLAA